MKIDAEVRTLVDRLLLEQGEYQPVELLLAEGRLFYEDYETWRTGGGAPLAEALFGDPETIAGMLDQAAAYAQALGLTAERLDTRPWGGGPPLSYALSPALDERLRTRYRRPAERAQFDLFLDSGSTTLVNGVLQALAGRDLEEAMRQLERLRDGDPGHARLGALERLLEAARPVAMIGDPASELERLERQTVPLAEELLGGDARHLLSPLWRRLAEALAGHPFDPRRPELHASYALARCGDWGGAAAAVEVETGWQGHAPLLLRHAEAMGRLQRPDFGDWARLCWRFPEQAERVEALAGGEWRPLWRRFIELEPELEDGEFPAWVLLQRPAWRGQVDDALLTEAPEPFRLLLALLGAPEAIEARRRLKECAPELFRHCLG